MCVKLEIFSDFLACFIHESMTKALQIHNPDFATLAHVGPDDLGGAGLPQRRMRGAHGLLWANRGLFLAGEQINFLAELVRQKCQLADGLCIHILGSLMARYLHHVGVDHIDAGVHGVVQFPRKSVEFGFMNQAAKIGCAVQPG